MISKGAHFPDFALQDQSGSVVTLASLLGKPFVIYFYPKDDTSGCTMEACEFRDVLSAFGDIPVIGVSPDSVASHGKFVKKFSLNFPLLADPEKTLCQACGVWVEKSMYGKKYMGVERTTCLVSATGTVEQVWNKVSAAGHAAEVLESALRS